MSNHLIDYSDRQSLAEIWDLAATKLSQVTALQDPHSDPPVRLNYQELVAKIKQFAAGMQALGVTPESKISLFSDNSPQWFIADQGIMMAGAVDIVRSSQAEKQELTYIIQDSDSEGLVVENLKTYQKLKGNLTEIPLKFIILLSEETPPTEEPFRMVNFSQLMELGANQPLQPVTKNKQDLATLIYTSGTTGQPKGVMLSHGNLLHQINTLTDVLQPNPGDKCLSILPSWHSYERTCEYFLLSQGCSIVYTNIRYMKKDLKQFEPEYMVGVPRLWESIYEGIQKQFREQPQKKQNLVKFFLNNSEKYILSRRIAQSLSLDNLNPSPLEKLIASLKTLALFPLHALGEKLVYSKIRDAISHNIKVFFSGGGSLAIHIENFYEIINIPVLVGYGLTETSPVVTARRFYHNLRGSAGKPIPETEVSIVDPETRQILPKGEKGLVLLRGPQIMQGYYKKPEATAKAIDPEGWFDSGDLGMLTAGEDLIITGRAKDTIVLSNGENIEPQPLEDACVRSAYIDQIMVVGQDQRSLGALIIPNLEALEKWAISQQLDLKFPDPTTPESELEKTDLYHPQIIDLFKKELTREVQNRPGYRIDDRITSFVLILEPFSIENGLMTQTLKIKRPVVTERYQAMINEMFAKN
jgi:long-chain acyl-CoA synthetase